MIKEYTSDTKSAIEAISQAQRIAFAPMLFMATVCIRDFGILEILEQHDQGLNVDEIVEKSQLNAYTVQLLLDVGLSAKVVYTQDGRYYLSKVGHFILHDQMTRVNMDFTRDICYQGMGFLKESFISGKPEGLKVFSQSDTIYPVLSTLPEPARSSWFAFDHYYSDNSREFMLEKVFSFGIKSLVDLGANTGKWALACLKYNDQVSMIAADLKEQICICKENISKAGFNDRIEYLELNILQDCTLPENKNWWLSQFLDCFATEQIVDILRKIHNVISKDNYVFVQELFWDRQRFEAASCSLNASSLYFTALANGYSRFYGYEPFLKIIDQSGLKVEQVFDHNITGHTLLVLKKK